MVIPLEKNGCNNSGTNNKEARTMDACELERLVGLTAACLVTHGELVVDWDEQWKDFWEEFVIWMTNAMPMRHAPPLPPTSVCDETEAKMRLKPPLKWVMRAHVDGDVIERQLLRVVACMPLNNRCLAATEQGEIGGWECVAHGIYTRAQRLRRICVDIIDHLECDAPSFGNVLEKKNRNELVAWLLRAEKQQSYHWGTVFGLMCELLDSHAYIASELNALQVYFLHIVHTRATRRDKLYAKDATYSIPLLAMPHDLLHHISQQMSMRSRASLMRTTREFGIGGEGSKRAILSVGRPQIQILTSVIPQTDNYSRPMQMPHYKTLAPPLGQERHRGAPMELRGVVDVDIQIHVHAALVIKKRRPVPLKHVHVDGVGECLAVPCPDKPSHGTLPDDALQRRGPLPVDSEDARDEIARHHWMQAERGRKFYSHDYEEPWELDAEWEYERVPWSSHFAMPVVYRAYLVDADTLANVHDCRFPNDTALKPSPKTHTLRMPNAERMAVFTAPRHVTGCKLYSDAVEKLPAQGSFLVKASSHRKPTLHRLFRVAVRGYGYRSKKEFQSGRGYDFPVAYSEPMELVSGKKVLEARANRRVS